MVDPPRKQIPFPSLKRSRFPGRSIKIIRIIPGLSLVALRACKIKALEGARSRHSGVPVEDDDLNFLLKNYSTTLWRPSSPIIFADFIKTVLLTPGPLVLQCCSIASVFTASKAVKFFLFLFFWSNLLTPH